jgi:hypothetical protein
VRGFDDQEWVLWMNGIELEEVDEMNGKFLEKCS